MMVLKRLAVGLFTSIMGLCGLAIAWRQFEQFFKISFGISLILTCLSYLAFAVLAAMYLTKYIKFYHEVKAEFNHPVSTSFFPAISISLLLLSVETIGFNREFAWVSWIMGTVLHFFFTLVIVSRWIDRSYDIVRVNPSWFLPVVGNIIISIAGTDFVNVELLWFFFSTGFFFWLIMFTIIFYRVVFETSMPDAMLPTLFIFVAPPALCFVAYTKINGAPDNFAHVLLYISFVLLLILLTLIKRFLSLDFSITWWAYTFPLCSVSIAAFTAASIFSINEFAWLGSFLLAAVSVIVIIVLFKTIETLFDRNKII